MTQQGYRQFSARAITGMAETYDGDWHALFDMDNIPAGDFNGRMLAWINDELDEDFTNIADALQAFAEEFDAYNFSSLGLFDFAPAPAAGAGFSSMFAFWMGGGGGGSSQGGFRSILSFWMGGAGST